MGIARLGMMLRGVALLVVFASIGHCTTEEGKKWLAENAKKPGVIELPSGLQYKVVKSVAKGKSSSASSPCECHYRGTLTDGTEFDSSYKRGKPTTFAPNQVVSGWTEAMQLMKQGEKWELFLPSELAYGESKRGQHITPGAVLVFELEILKVNEGGPFDWITGQPHYLIFGAFILFKLYQSGVFGGGASASAGPLVPMSEATSANDPRVFFDITIGEEAAGRIEFELFQKVVPKTVRISVACVLARRTHHCISRTLGSIESFQGLCAREATSLTTTGGEVNQSTDRSLQMNLITGILPTRNLCCSQWLILDPTPTDRSSSSLWAVRRIWMGSMLSSVACVQERRWSRQWKQSGLVQEIAGRES